MVTTKGKGKGSGRVRGPFDDMGPAILGITAIIAGTVLTPVVARAGYGPVSDAAASAVAATESAWGWAESAWDWAADPVDRPAAGGDYDREKFGQSWADTDRNGCDTRNDILARDLDHVRLRDGSDCVVVAGWLTDPYTGERVEFRKHDAGAVHVDHVVALAEAWQSGADSWSTDRRVRFANDPRNLLAAQASVNMAKSDHDAAEWMPPRDQCGYARRVVVVKVAYGLAIDRAERRALDRALASC